MDFLTESIQRCEELRLTLSRLRETGKKEDLVTYYERMLEIADRQSVIYTRLRLMGDPESVQVADEMEHAAEQLWGKSPLMRMPEYMQRMKDEIEMSLKAIQALEG